MREESAPRLRHNPVDEREVDEDLGIDTPSPNVSQAIAAYFDTIRIRRRFVRHPEEFFQLMLGFAYRLVSRDITYGDTN
ncbi:MAG: hypothetical protein ACI9SE_003602 [Neolewinella sp.]|jgi:hypothetical protein